MSLIICFIIIVSIAAALAEMFKEKIDITIPITVIAIVLIIYPFGFFYKLHYGVYIIYGVSVIAMIYLLCKCIMYLKKKKFTEFISRIITPGIVVYLLFWIFFIVLNKRRLFSNWDEFSHWGLIVKNMFVFDSYGTNPETIVLFRGYPPFTAIFEYFFLRIKNYYTEGEIIIAMNVLYTSMIMPLMKNISWKKNLPKLLIIIPMLFLLPLCFYQEFYTTVYVDAILGIFMAYILYIYFTIENIKLKYISICLGIIALPLIKAAGTGLAVFALVIIIIDILSKIKKNQIESKRKSIILIIVLIMSLIIGKYSWGIHLKCSNTAEAWSTSQVTLNNITLLLTGKGEQYYYQVAENFKEQFFKKPIEIGFGTITNFQLLVIYAIYSIFLCHLVKQKNDRVFKRYRTMCILLVLCYIIYMISLLILYIFSFSEYEAIRLASYSRYSYIYAIGMFALNTFLIIDFISKNKIDKNTIITLTSILCLIVPISTLENLLIKNKAEVETTISYRKEYMDIDRYNDILNKGDTIYYISCGSTGFDSHVTRYLLVSEKYKYIKTMNNFGWSLGPERFTGDIWSLDITKEEFCEYLIQEKIGYVYIFRADDIFKEKYGELFEKLDDIKNKTMYKIYENQNEIVLKEFIGT